MKHTLKKVFTKKNLLIFTSICAALIAITVSTSFMIINTQKKYIYNDKTNSDLYSAKVILVLGGGVDVDGTPKQALKNRLDAAYELFTESGNHSAIIVSGDNRFEYYNEPTAMKNYLVNEKNLPASVVYEDFAGRSTYESCERTKKIFELSEVVIISQKSHLPRAVFLCRSFGVRAVGYVADDVASISKSQYLRELAANVKALFNVYFIGEQTILGEKIPIP